MKPRQQAANLQEQLNQTWENEAEAIHAQRLSQKMQAKTEADLSNLRDKYQIKSQQVEELRNLVTQLRDKLTVAAGLYERLLDESPETLERLSLK